jgi:ornithine cyclodeaminase
MAESGDFIIPLKNGTVIEEKFTGDIGKLITGSLRGRETAEEITIFKSVGMAVMDVVTASQIYQKAREQGIGQEFFF